ncbi:MAG: Ldh family oxidoreductase [Anaerolineaceae bacterium]|nr:Ldh family oxidoreductase [Anaerolineaceae bacterium]
MTLTLIRVPVDELDAFVYEAFKAMGMSDSDARMCANGLMQSELHCHPGQGQGVAGLLGYHRRISNGWYTLNAPFEIVKESPALALVDAHNGPGSVASQRAMQLAVDKAKVSGIGTVIVRNSTHFGSSAVHARIAAEQECIGIAMTNAGPEMAPWGAASGVVGTNPWGLAAPTGGEFPVVLDVALTTAGKGMMRWYERKGKKMPLDWALTPEGYETDDPAAAMAGALLGIGQYKGFGLAMLTDVLTGVIGGGGFGLVPYADPTKLDVSHTFIALDIAWFMPVAVFKQRMDDFIHQIKSAKLRPGFSEILVPGEIDYRREQQRRGEGTQMDSEIFDKLRDLAQELKIDFPFERDVISTV